LAAIRQRFILLGRNADSRSACQTTRLLVRKVADLFDTLGSPLGYALPTLAFRAPGLVVICKPAGWETDVYDVAKFGVPITPVARFYLLSSFVSKLFPEDEYPINHLPEYGFGFVHRLDQMSSGLILAATNFESHYYLQWQMCCYSIDREYFVLCHGSVLPAPHVLRLRGRILEGKHRVHARSSFGDRCHVHPRGKPAESRVLPVAHIHLGQGDESLGAVAISIVTGRQHQIRTHMQHIGHPTVYDGRYGLRAIVLSGLCREDAARVPERIVQSRPLLAQHKMELSLRGAYA